MAYITRMLGMSSLQDVPSEPKSGDPKDALELVSFPPPGESLASGTPFCAKIEVALRLAGIEFKGYAGDVTNAKHAPKHKFPVLRHGSNVVCDSSCIFDYLLATYPNKMKMFTPSDPKTAALALALQRMLEEDLYFGLMYFIWQRDDVWACFGPGLFSEVPPVLRSVVMASVRASVIKGLWSQGIGRHSLEYVLERVDGSLQACEVLISDSGAYLTGAEAVQADLFLFGICEEVLKAYPADAAVAHPMQALIEKCPGLMALHKRLRERAWPDGTSSDFKEKVPAS